MPENLTVSRLAFLRTVRLVSTARLREAVLTPLADNDDELAELAEIEGATSTRRIAQRRGFDGIDPSELVFDVPHAVFINASFSYAKPREPNRFNGPNRGAWYAALVVQTCLTEVIFHMTEFLRRTGEYHATVEYAEMFASHAGEFIDLREGPADHPSLDPDTSKGYPAGNELADSARRQGLNGIVYPSVRHEGGTCFAILRPAAVQAVAQGGIFHVSWRGAPVPHVERVEVGPNGER